MLRILHFWQNFIPWQGEDLTKRLLNYNGISGKVLAEKIILRNGRRDTVSADYPWLEYFSKNFKNNKIERINRLICGRIFYKLYNRRIERFIEESIHRNKPHILHAHFGPAGCRLINMKKKFDLPLLVNFYGVDVSQCLKVSKTVAAYKELFKVVDFCRVLCDRAKERLIEIGCPAEKIVLFNCMMDTHDFEYHPRRPGDVVRFIIAARFVEKKGYSYLLKAFSELAHKGRDISLTIIGYGPLKPAILDAIQGFDIAERIRVIDTSNVERFETLYSEELRNHDVFVMPSITADNGDDEGGPAMTMISAQSAGLPVIAAPFPGSERSIFEGETGMYCRERDSVSLAEKMDYFIHHKNIWNVIGKKASNYVQENFSIESHLKKNNELYNYLIWKHNG